MKSFKEFLSERSAPVSKAVLPKVTKEQLRDIILKGEDINTVDYSDVSDMSWMFQECSSLVEIPHLDTSKVTNMYAMFDGCSDIEKISLSDTSKVTTMSYMFYKCSSLKEVPHLDTSKVTYMYRMFDGCSDLEYLEEPMDFVNYEWNKEMHPLIFKKYPQLFV